MSAANPLDAWTAARIGADQPLTSAKLQSWQLARLRETITWARQHSPFYRQRLQTVDEQAIASLDDLRRLPLTTADDLRRNDPPLLCVSQSEISHVVTLETSGTSGPPKRVFFTAQEQEATLDFFDHGMRLPARVGDRVLILFPGDRPGSVGDLLVHALTRLGATAIPCGWPHDLAAAVTLLRRESPEVVVGAPVPMLAVARHAAAAGGPPIAVRRVLLSADHAAGGLRRSLADLWGCEVYEHYGMTEMGLGGGVDCAAHAGYHIRENELLIEVVDPASGAPVASGATGEVVFTTLNRRAMPLVRYRTGDISYLVPGRCACGSPLTRLGRIARRIAGGVDLGGGELTIGMLDEAIFAVDAVTDFTASFHPAWPPRLRIDVDHAGRNADSGVIASAVYAALANIPVLAAVHTSGARLTLNVAPNGGFHRHVGKRRIAVEAMP
jgi:phenylacetate-coenzyme A ligase PaaK-like adenylate-forming protein